MLTFKIPKDEHESIPIQKMKNGEWAIDNINHCLVYRTDRGEFEIIAKDGPGGSHTDGYSRDVKLTVRLVKVSISVEWK